MQYLYIDVMLIQSNILMVYYSILVAFETSKSEQIITQNKQQIQLLSIFSLPLQMLSQYKQLNALQPQQSSSDHLHLKLVNIYFRLSSKIGVKLIVPNRIKVKDLASIVQTELKIQSTNQIIYFASKKYEPDSQVVLDLVQGSILHVHDKGNSQLGKIKINLQEIRCEGSSSKSIEYSINSEMKIQQFIQLHLQRQNIKLVESGRWLDINKSFQEQNIQNQATIYCVSIGKQLDPEEFQKDFNSLFQDQQQSQKQNNQKALQKVKEQRKKRLEAKKIKRHEMSSSSEMQNLQPKFDFKKKKSAICLKAVKKNPEDIGYTWKLDRSSSESKSSKKLAKALKGKKTKKQLSNTEGDLQNECMSPNAKLALRQQVKRLFMSQNLGLKAMNKNKVGLGVGREVSQMRQSEQKQKLLFESCQQSQAVF